MDALMQNLFGLAAGLIGAIVGGYFTLYAANKQIRETARKEARDEEKEIENLLAALRVEVGTLWQMHMNRIGAMVEAIQPGQALEFYYPLTQDYFTVYNSNAGRIGKIRDPQLCEAIVVCYNKCKKVVDGFKYNNELYRDWRDQADLPGGDAARVKAKFQLLSDYAQLVKADHFELKAYVERMMGLLKA